MKIHVGKRSIAKFAKSKCFIPAIVTFLVIVGWFFLLLGQQDVSEEGLPSGPTWSQKEDYKIVEGLDGKFVENERAGLRFKVPEGWKVEIFAEEVNIVSSEVEFGPHGISIKQIQENGGCGISIQVSEYDKDSFNESHTRIQQIKEFISSCERLPSELLKEGYQVIEIDHRKALKEASESYVSAQVVDEKVIYFFNTYLLSKDVEKCSQEFNEFLETVSINK